MKAVLEDRLVGLPSGSRNAWRAAALLFLMHFMFGFMLLYSPGAGEPDAIAMTNGVYQAALKKTWYGENLYMLFGQPLYYGLFFLVQGTLRLNYDDLSLVMNLVSLIFSGLSTAVAFGILRSFCGTAAAGTGALLLISSPTIIEWSSYTHPVSISCCLVLLAVYVVILGVKSAPMSKCWWGGIAVGAVVAGLAVGVRADAAILLHLLVLVPLAGDVVAKQPFLWKKVIYGGSTAFLALLTGLLILRPFVSPSAGGVVMSVPAKLQETVRQFYELIPVHDGLLELVFGLGVAGSMLFLIALGYALKNRRVLAVAMIAAMLVPPLIFAMGNPQPGRRFMHAIFAAVLAVGFLWQLIKNRRLASIGPVLAFVAIIINFWGLPLLGSSAKAAGFPLQNHSLLHRATVAIFNHHSINQRYVISINPVMKRVRAEASEGSLLTGDFSTVQFLVASGCRDGLPVTSKVVESAPGYHLTQVAFPDKLLFVCEYYTKIATVPFPNQFNRVYDFTGQGSQLAGAGIQVTDLSRRPEEHFRMWFRGAV